MDRGTDTAPGWPGTSPRGCGAAKQGIGTAVAGAGRAWFTIERGRLTETFWPTPDRVAARELRLIVTDGAAFHSDEADDAEHDVRAAQPGVPAYRVVSTCARGRYRLEKEVVADPELDAVLLRVRFEPLLGAPADYRLFVWLAPQLSVRGTADTAWVADVRAAPRLFAAHGERALALASSAPWRAASAGFAGNSDGAADLRRHGRLTSLYARADAGATVLTGEVDLAAASGGFTLALGFGTAPASAEQQARAALERGFEAARREYVAGWTRWQASLRAGDDAHERARVATSAAVLGTLHARAPCGAVVASLATPWGEARADPVASTYHLAWARDMTQWGGAMLALGAHQEVRRVLGYLRSTQEADGHWAQNLWLSGAAHWTAVESDQVALPVLLVDLAHREGALDDAQRLELWPTVRRAAGFIARAGPCTPKDRWEDSTGLMPFAVASQIAALLAAADLASLAGEPAVASYLRETADAWNDSIDRWLYRAGGELATRLGIAGCYVRARLAKGGADACPERPRRAASAQDPTADDVVSPDALALVRFGLRAADDPRMLDTVRAIDALLRVEFATGPAWRRYAHDSYGEHADGAPFDGDGIGRPWPLLTGERAHYELAAGRLEAARALLTTFESFASAQGLLPEQIWDGAPVPSRGLHRGGPTGSATPLGWTHAEHVKLCRSLRAGAVFDLPRHAAERYLGRRTTSRYAVWRADDPRTAIARGQRLRVEACEPTTVEWSTDGWRSTASVVARDSGLGVYVADVPSDALPAGTALTFRRQRAASRGDAGEPASVRIE